MGRKNEVSIPHRNTIYLNEVSYPHVNYPHGSVYCSRRHNILKCYTMFMDIPNGVNNGVTDNLLDDERRRKLILISKDFYRYAELNLFIKNKGGDIVPFAPNRIQKKIIEYVLDDLQNDRPIRYIILKARQEGVSTLIEALIYWWTATHKNIKSKIVAHENSTSKELYEMFRRYYDNTNILFKNSVKYNTRSDLSFDNDEGTGLKSQIDVASAQNTGVGRGQTISWLHCSEVSLWRDGEELVAGLMQAVPRLPKTAIFIESTANGIGDYFHKTWQAAKTGTSSFKPLFFSWAEHEEYRLKPPPYLMKNGKLILTEEEEELKRDYHLEDDQIYWRREKLKDFPDNPDKFKQEYPINDIEAFLASGRSRFHIPTLVDMELDCEPGREVELIEKDDFKLVDVKHSPLQIWEEPLPKNYVIGADVAEGTGGDFSVATVMDVETTTTVARWRGDCEPHEFGEILEQLGRYYNNALIACEINNHGLTTVQRLRDLHYPNLYRRETGLDERFENMTTHLGWKTDRKTKSLLINSLAEAILTRKIIDKDKIFISECMSYVIDERGRTNAQIGTHDDTVISTAIALQVFDWTDVSLKRKEVKSKLPEKYMEIRRKMKNLAKK